jgi:hypothetical protein
MANPKRPRDANQLAKMVVDISTGATDSTSSVEVERIKELLLQDTPKSRKEAKASMETLSEVEQLMLAEWTRKTLLKQMKRLQKNLEIEHERRKGRQ